MNKSALLLVGLFSVGGNTAQSCGEGVKPISATVVEEKVMCISEGGCVQEIVAQYKEHTLVVTNSKKPWVEAGEMVKLLKLKGVYFPNRRRSGQSYFYKLARYCDPS